MIISADNPKVKRARALLERRGREQQGYCLAEGVRLVEDIMRAGVRPALVFFIGSARQAPRAQALLDTAQSNAVPVWELSPAVFGTLSETVTSQGVIAVLPIPSPVLPSDPTLILVLDQLRDPGNMGTILRGTEAAGVDMVMLTSGCADIWSPKVMRAGMGAQFRLAIETETSWGDIARRTAGYPIWMADPRGDITYDQIDWTQRSVLVVGGETTGLSPDAVAISRGRVRIPMHGCAESLNAAMAATVLLFEAARQRRHTVGQA